MAKIESDVSVGRGNKEKRDDFARHRQLDDMADRCTREATKREGDEGDRVTFAKGQSAGRFVYIFIVRETLRTESQNVLFEITRAPLFLLKSGKYCS